MQLNEEQRLLLSLALSEAYERIIKHEDLENDPVARKHNEYLSEMLSEAYRKEGSFEWNTDSGTSD